MQEHDNQHSEQHQGDQEAQGAADEGLGGLGVWHRRLSDYSSRGVLR